jgi:hypothetical protein
MVEYFLASGASVDLPDDKTWSTPSFWAEYLEHTEVAKVLSETKRQKKGP